MKLLRLIYKKMYYIINYKKFNPKIEYNEIDKVVFVAHPDDELIFLGNELITKDKWLVVCMTNGDSRTRSKEFVGLMKELNVQYRILDFKDGLNEQWDNAKAKDIISKIISSKDNWKMIVTHNKYGEYGHFQHKQLNKLVNEVCKNDNIKVFCTKDRLFDCNNRLSKESKENKLKLANKYYKSQINVIKNLSDYLEYEGIE